MSPFGAALPHVRAAAGLTQNTLAARMGIKRSTIARIEGGDSVPKVMTMHRIIAALEPLIDVTPLREAMDPEQTSLAAQVRSLTNRLEKMQTRYGAAMSRNEMLRLEIDRLRRAESPTIASGAFPDGHTPTAEPEPIRLPPPFLPVSRLERYLKMLFETDDEEDCRIANQALRYVTDLVVALEAERPGLKDRRRTA